MSWNSLLCLVSRGPNDQHTVAGPTGLQNSGHPIAQPGPCLCTMVVGFLLLRLQQLGPCSCPQRHTWRGQRSLLITGVLGKLSGAVTLSLAPILYNSIYDIHVFKAKYHQIWLYVHCVLYPLVAVRNNYDSIPPHLTGNDGCSSSTARSLCSLKDSLWREEETHLLVINWPFQYPTTTTITSTIPIATTYEQL